MYDKDAHRATPSDSSLSHRASYLDDVDYLRSTPDEVVVVSSEVDQALRFTFCNGLSVVIPHKSLRWYAKHKLDGIQTDFAHALTAVISRHIFRSLGGRKFLGVRFEDWPFATNFLGCPD